MLTKHLGAGLSAEQLRLSPNKSAHQAVHSLGLNLQFKGYGYIVEADIKGFFDNMDHDWLKRMLDHRIDDNALLSLIGQSKKISSPPMRSNCAVVDGQRLGGTGVWQSGMQQGTGSVYLKRQNQRQRPVVDVLYGA